MVNSESRFEDLLLVHVDRLDERSVRVAFLAGEAAWFAPEEPDSDPDGWLRDICDFTGEATLNYADADACERDTGILAGWCRDDVRLRAASLLDRQATVFLDPVTKVSVAIVMNPDDMDRP